MRKSGAGHAQSAEPTPGRFFENDGRGGIVAWTGVAALSGHIVADVAVNEAPEVVGGDLHEAFAGFSGGPAEVGGDEAVAGLSRGLSAAGGSVESTSSPAAWMRPESGGFGRACSSISGPRPVLMSMAVGFMPARRLASTMWRVLSVSGQWSELCRRLRRIVEAGFADSCGRLSGLFDVRP